jgi:hypothetical protein
MMNGISNIQQGISNRRSGIQLLCGGSAAALQSAFHFFGWIFLVGYWIFISDF